jgi:hypothetical protein
LDNLRVRFIYSLISADPAADPRWGTESAISEPESFRETI